MIDRKYFSIFEEHIMKTLDFCKAHWNSAEAHAAFGDAYVITVSADDMGYADFGKALTAAGWKLYTAREEAQNRFAAYVGFGEKLFLCFSGFSQKLRMVVERGEGLLPPRAEEQHYTVRTTPAVTQVKLAYCKADCGMSYIIRLSDGRFVVIDGGYDEYEEAERLYDVLNGQNVLDHIRVAAWIITHPHGDHYLCFMRFCKDYGDRVEIEQLLYNWPLPEMCKYPCNTAAYDALVESLGIDVIVPHTGQRFCYADAVFDVLFACEDLYPNIIRNTNDSSIVFRMDLGGKRFLWVADAEFVSCEEICRTFSAKELKCDVLQVGHHGYDGGSPELYRRSDPETLLWPCPDFWYYPVRLWKSNAFLRTSKNIKHIFIEGHGTTVLDMSLSDPASAADVSPVLSSPLYVTDFETTRRVVDLGWSCITGGDTGYSSPEIVLSQDGCTLTTHGRAVCQVRRPDQMENARSYMLTLKAEATLREGGRIGLICNYANPTVWNEDEVCWLSFDGETDEIGLTLDADAHTASLWERGSAVRNWTYLPAERRGVYLVIEHARLLIKEIQITEKR